MWLPRKVLNDKVLRLWMHPIGTGECLPANYGFVLLDESLRQKKNPTLSKDLCSIQMYV